MTHARAALLAVFLPSMALAEGGGGVHVEGVYLPRYGPVESAHDAPGLIGCIGGSGYGVRKGGFRIGGELTFCRDGDQDVAMTYGGAQLGWWGRGKIFYWSGYGSVGLGTQFDGSTPGVGPYQSVFAYVQPTVSVGFPLGFTAMEVGVYGMLPLNFAQFINDGAPRGYVTPAVGARVSFLFGNFWRPKKHHAKGRAHGADTLTCSDCATPSCRGACQTPPPPAPAAPPPPPADEGPLAIPADPSPPPPPEDG